ncbi:hypothetical protein AGMMS49545_01010 [Betaproteobacteria bacterium]|nr:hypothetical protein AGMMS49545_01010 [Betaproteobacteria bacterium]
MRAPVDVRAMSRNDAVARHSREFGSVREWMSAARSWQEKIKTTERKNKARVIAGFRLLVNAF